jgi:hypothetical protein
MGPGGLRLGMYMNCLKTEGPQMLEAGRRRRRRRR